MKKTLIALAVLGAAGVAHAQSNVTIYGIVDVGVIKSTGNPVYMDENVNNRIGFMGSEDLGGGLKATFQLEHRFDLFNGAERGGAMFDGGANLGLAGSFGHVRVGRLNQISTETYRTLDPFYQYGVAGMVESVIREARISDTIRYDSPNFNGFKVMGSYTLKTANGGSDTGDHAGFAVGGTYTNGPLFLVANYNKASSFYNFSGDTFKDYNWNIGGAYAFGPARLTLGYEESKLGGDDVKQKNWLIGLEYTIGAGRINAAYSQGKFNNNYDVDGVNKEQKYAIGYTHNLSKRTAVYANYAHDKVTSPSVSGVTVSDSVNSVQVGMTHKF